MVMLIALFPSTYAAAPQPPQDARGAIAVYCADTCPALSTTFDVQNRLPARARQPVLAAERWGDDFDLPEPDQLQAWGQGDLTGLTEAKDVVLISWAAPPGKAVPTAARAVRAALSIGQWFEDLDSGTFYDAATLQTLQGRIQGNHPDITALLLLEATEQADNNVRMFTRGMGKLGLPELIMEDVSVEGVNAAGLTLNATAQLLFERGYTDTFPLNGAEILSSSVRTAACGVNGAVTLTEAVAKPNDPLGPLAQVRFEGDVAPCVQSIREPPVEEPQAAPKPPPTLQSVQAAAMARLQGPVRAAFAQGLPPGERLLVKAPFEGPAVETEWMWVEVTQWRQNGQLVGRLLNDPRLVPDLQRGDLVAVESKIVFDYLWQRADGQSEGNTTQAYLRAGQ